MNIKILDSWLRDYVKTKATPQQIAEKLSLSSVSVERMEKFNKDLVYDIEVTTNRPELMSIIGLARETVAVLNRDGIKAEFINVIPSGAEESHTTKLQKHHSGMGSLHAGRDDIKLTIKSNPNLVNRVCAVVMEVTIKESPKHIKERLESTDIRSLNNVIDVTNYVMRTIGHPTHVFDYDRLPKQVLTIRESQRGETIKTLDGKTYILPGGDIVADDGKNTIVDLLGIMGLENSVVTNDTKRIVFFVNNTEPTHVRKTSMQLGIRTEAAVLNEKGIDPELAMDALLYGIELFKEVAGAKVVSEIIDIYPNKIKTQTVTVSEEQIHKVIGVKIPLQQSKEILESLGFTVTAGSSLQLDPKRSEAGFKPAPATGVLTVTSPSFRAKDIEIPEDIIEEIARIYGYHNIPNKLPAIASSERVDLEEDAFYWEDRIKDALKYWGFTETYTYPMVSKELYGPVETAVEIQNPLNEDLVYMRRSLVPSLLKVAKDNPDHESVKLFEFANVYEKKSNNLPLQTIKIGGVIKKPKVSFFEAKGIIEQLLTDLEIKTITWKPLEIGQGASLHIHSPLEGSGRSRGVELGTIEILAINLISFELDFQTILDHATLKKTYKPVSKYPPSFEDLAIIAPRHVTVGEIIDTIKKQSSLIADVSLLDKYQDTRTFHVVYQSYEKNLTGEEVGEIREKILKVLQEKFGAKLKE